MNATSNASPAPAARIAPDAWRAFGGIWRLTFRRFLLPAHWLALAGMVAVLALICLGFLSAGNGPVFFVSWAVKFYFTFLVPVMAFISAAGAIRDDMRAGTVDYVLTRPVPRPMFILFRYLSHTACAQVDFLFAFGALLAVAAYRDVPGLRADAPLLFFAQVLLVTGFSAFGFLCGVLTSRYVMIGIGYAAVIEVGVGQIPTQLNQLSMTHQVRGMLQPLASRVPSPFATSLDLLPAAGGLPTLGVLLAFTVVMLGLAAAVFAFREFTGQADA